MKTDIEQQLLDLLGALAETGEEEIDCDDFMHRVAAFVENFDSGGNLSEKFYAEAKHLRICRECMEEFEALLAIARSDGKK